MRWIRERALRGALVVVNQHQGDGLRGVVVRLTRDWVILRSVKAQSGNQTLELSCDPVMVPRSTVAWIGVETKDAAL